MGERAGYEGQQEREGEEGCACRYTVEPEECKVFGGQDEPERRVERFYACEERGIVYYVASAVLYYTVDLGRRLIVGIRPHCISHECLYFTWYFVTA